MTVQFKHNSNNNDRYVIVLYPFITCDKFKSD